MTMADEHTTSEETTLIHPNILTGLSFAGGIGLLTIFITLGIAVVTPPEDPRIVGLFVLAGALILVAAILGWFFVVQPHKHFDDINEPLEAEHH